jgi:hypothetical protein
VQQSDALRLDPTWEHDLSSALRAFDSRLMQTPAESNATHLACPCPANPRVARLALRVSVSFNRQNFSPRQRSLPSKTISLNV